jgi:hypothetical protein
MLLTNMHLTDLVAQAAEYERIGLCNEDREQPVDVYTQDADTGEWGFRATVPLRIAMDSAPPRSRVTASTAVVAAAVFVHGHRPNDAVRPLIYAHQRLVHSESAQPEVPVVGVTLKDRAGRSTAAAAQIPVSRVAPED